MRKMDTKVVLNYNDGGIRMKGIPQGSYTKEFLRQAGSNISCFGSA